MKKNLIIRASAGTGKTFALATRFIRLMMFQNVKPSSIVALTFSRAAAQEIYMKLIERLWEAAVSEEGASRERNILTAGLSSEDLSAVEKLDWSAGRFSRMLRAVIDEQHHGAIATLDSFILRIVRSFPLEFGFQHAVEVLDSFGEKRAIDEARDELLKGTDEKGDFASAFEAATCGQFSHRCSKVLGDAIKGWREFLVAHPDCREWDICKALGFVEMKEPSVGILPTTGKSTDPFGQIVTQLKTFSGVGDIFLKNKGGELMRFLSTHPGATEYTYLTDSGNEKKISCSEEAAGRIREIVRYLLFVKVRRIAELIRGKLEICDMIERVYDVSTRRRGLLTFSDFTECQACAERDYDKALRLENLQFRFDSRFDHWELDEFQDTSALQWLCLRRLVNEAAGRDSGSVMAVGDLKQSIYTWRGGNDAPFKEMMLWPEFNGDIGEIIPNDISYRYEKNTADFINKVFGPENVRNGGVLPAECSQAVERWLASDCWMEHRPDSKNGQPKANDYVAVYAIEKGEGESAGDAGDDNGGRGRTVLKVLAPSICELVADLWKRHEENGSTDTVGILLRDNEDGLALAEYLRNWKDCNLPVVWEGMDDLLDSPIVMAVLELLKLAEHPEDTFSWKTVNDLLPVREIVFPETTHAKVVSLEVSRMLTKLGLARTLRAIVGKIVGSEKCAPDERSRTRLESLVRAAVNYETRRSATDGITSFIKYLASTAGRETSSSPHVIRILTIHRSKGLTLDHLIVPILESSATDPIDKPRRGTPLSGNGWALEGLGEEEAMIVEPIAEAWRKASNDSVLESLRLNYVALTRARKSTHVFVCKDAGSNGVQFRNLLVRPFGGMSSGREFKHGRIICELGKMPDFAAKDEVTLQSVPWVHGKGTGGVRRHQPSAFEGGRDVHTKTSSSVLFAADKVSAADRGIAAHDRYAKIEWIDPSAPKDETESRIIGGEWSAAFVKSEDALAVWRERSYELFIDGVWESGQFDRVVFRVKDGVRSATVYDFKTNAMSDGEDKERFISHMKAQYASQLESYRRAVNRLTGIPIEKIETVLLLESTGQAVVVGDSK